MFLLDHNNEPTSTVYYLAASTYGYLKANDGADAINIYRFLCTEVAKKSVNYDFFLMGLDFLYLLDVLEVDETGGLHVHQTPSHS